MPLFRSHSNSEAAPRRTDLERQIGCIAGFFQIFDQQTRKQIAAAPPPRKEAPLQQQPSPAPESHSFIDSVSKEDNLTLGNQCTDPKAAVRDDPSLTDTSVETLVSAASQLGYVHDASLTNFTQEDKLHRPGKSSNVREELPQANAMVRHGSFNYTRDYKEDDISFSPRRGHIGAYAAGGRRFTSKEMDTQGRFSVDTNEESRGLPREDDRYGVWSSPASHWPGGDAIAAQQEPTRDIAAEGVKGRWLAKGGREAERQWAAQDSLEDWKQSLRALVRLREDRETAVSSSRAGYIAPKASPRAVRNDPSASPARASAFDFKDAIRWSQRASTQTECSRRSLDDRDLPRSIADLRDAIHARSRLLSAPSPPPSPRPPSVVARLMGLDDLPKPAPTPEPAPLMNHLNRKPSGEAKLLQQLLQYSPPTPPSFTSHTPLPPSPTSNLLRRRDYGANTANSVDNSTHTPYYKNLPMRSEVQSMLKNIESIAHTGSADTSSAKLINSISNHSHVQECTGHVDAWAGATEHRPFRSSAMKNNQQKLPVVVLKQSEEICSPLPCSSHGFHDEIERRLRQLGLQSSEQERKTLKQILEAMQIKGLLQPPDGTRSSNVATLQQSSFLGSPVFGGSASPSRAPSSGIESWPPPVTSKSTARPHSNGIRSAKKDSGASIVIMRPVAKSSSRITSTGEDRRLGNERAGTPSRAEKTTSRKPKSAINPETSTLKESASSRSKSRSTTALPHNAVPTRKLSLRIRQSQVHLVKGPVRAMPSEQARKNGIDAPSIQHQQDALSKPHVKPVVTYACEVPSNAPENCILVVANHAHKTDIHSFGTIPDTESQRNFAVLGTSGATPSDVDAFEVTSTNESCSGTPPRDLKGELRFGENGNCCAKEVILEQCSPVSVLDAHLSDDDESSPAPESIRALTEFQEDISSCGPSVRDSRSLLQELKGIEAMQPIPMEMNFKTVMTDSIIESSASDKATDDALNVGQDSVVLLCKEDVLHDDMACACTSSYFVKAIAERPDDCTDNSRECEHIGETCANNGDRVHTEAALRRNGDSMCMDEDTCARDRRHMIDACASTVDRTYDVCRGKGDHLDEIWTNNADFCYTEDVLRAAGLIGACAADRWLACGGEICQEVFEELEEQWDAVNAEEEGGHLKTEDRDMGGELYRKSQQASMRRRLVFDCLNELVEGRLSWLGMPGACNTRAYYDLPVSMLWGDLQRLEQGPCSAEDSMYVMLQQDLHLEAGYSTPLCWSSVPTRLAAVALHLEHDIFDALVLEILPEATL